MGNALVEVLQTMAISLPASEVAMIVGLLAVCMLFRACRVGMVLAYLFAYNWGWRLFTQFTEGYLTGYLVFGCVVGVLAVVRMLQLPPRSRA